MKGKVIRRKLKLVRYHALSLADRCDFVATEKIREASVSFGEDFAIVCVCVKDQVEVAQVMCAFVYGATLSDLSFQRSASEDVEHAGGRLVTMTLTI